METDVNYLAAHGAETWILLSAAVRTVTASAKCGALQLGADLQQAHEHARVVTSSLLDLQRAHARLMPMPTPSRPTIFNLLDSDEVEMQLPGKPAGRTGSSVASTAEQ